MPSDAYSAAPEPVRLVDHDPRWSGQFEQERVALARVLAPWLAGPIEHIGSTAVPGLPAKPVIDIMVAVADLDSSRAAIEALKALEYLYAPYHAKAMHWFCKPHPSRRTHHLHLVPLGSPLWRERLRFRDRLRAEPETATRYVQLKRELAARFGHDREAYTDGKTDFIAGIVNPRPRQPLPF